MFPENNVRMVTRCKQGLVPDQCRDPATIGVFLLRCSDDHLYQKKLASDVSEPKKSVEAVGDDYEGVGKFSISDTGSWDDV